MRSRRAVAALRSRPAARHPAAGDADGDGGGELTAAQKKRLKKKQKEKEKKTGGAAPGAPSDDASVRAHRHCLICCTGWWALVRRTAPGPAWTL